jgi:hypothetical protein
MYDPQTGRTFDGINGPVSFRVNRNSGAESTIEGLMSMSALATIPESFDYHHAQAVEGNSYRVLQAENGERVIGTPVYYSGDWTGEGYVSAGRYVGLGEGQRMRLTFTLDSEQADDYLLYVAHVRQSTNSSAFLIPRADAPLTIDGDASDWSDNVPVLESNTARQLLRGGGLWRGGDVDSHQIRLQWDGQNLYLLAVVRDPEHQQDFTVSNVWQGDTLWLYVAATSGARALSAKLTLAQTPQGAQVWDWIHTQFAEGAVLAWTPFADGAGYTYEAAIPWAALDVDNPQAAARIGIEAGRGIGGNSFMDLTGRDPDVAANLLQLTLTEPGMEPSLGGTPEVALEVRLDREKTHVLLETVSPDSDYFWLDLLTSQPVRLEAGEHTIRYEYAGAEGSTNPGVSKIDAFYLQPATARRVFALPDGRQLTLTYNTLTGESSLEMTPS